MGILASVSKQICKCHYSLTLPNIRYEANKQEIDEIPTNLICKNCGCEFGSQKAVDIHISIGNCTQENDQRLSNFKVEMPSKFIESNELQR